MAGGKCRRDSCIEFHFHELAHCEILDDNLVTGGAHMAGPRMAARTSSGGHHLERRRNCRNRKKADGERRHPN
jgi:hypothetical protein